MLFTPGWAFIAGCRTLNHGETFQKSTAMYKRDLAPIQTLT